MPLLLSIGMTSKLLFNIKDANLSCGLHLQGAFTGLVVGLGIGIIRMGFTWSRSDVPCGSTDPDYRFDIVANVRNKSSKKGQNCKTCFYYLHTRSNSSQYFI